MAKDTEFRLASIIPGVVPQVQITHFVIMEEFNKKGFDTEKAMRSAVKEFLNTDEGKAIFTDNHFDFNWGDAVLHIPNKIWRNHGLLLMSYENTDVITVDHDENLGNL